MPGHAGPQSHLRGIESAAAASASRRGARPQSHLRGIERRATRATRADVDAGLNRTSEASKVSVEQLGARAP